MGDKDRSAKASTHPDEQGMRIFKWTLMDDNSGNDILHGLEEGERVEPQRPIGRLSK